MIVKQRFTYAKLKIQCSYLHSYAMLNIKKVFLYILGPKKHKLKLQETLAHTQHDVI